MTKQAVLAAMAIALAVGTADAQTTAPRKGGTLRMTAPYGTSLLQPRHPYDAARSGRHRCQSSSHRSLYKWDTAANKPVLELATGVTVSNGRARAHLQAARRCGVPPRPQDDGRRHHLVLHAHHGRHQGLSRRTLDPQYQGRGGRREEPSQGDFRPEEDRRLSRSKSRSTRRSSRVSASSRDHHRSILAKENVEEWRDHQNPVGLGPFKFKEHLPGSRLVAERWDKFYQAGKPYLDRVIVLVMGEASARDVAFRNKEIDLSVLGPAQYLAYKNDPDLQKAPCSRWPRCSPATWG